MRQEQGPVGKQTTFARRGFFWNRERTTLTRHVSFGAGSRRRWPDVFCRSWGADDACQTCVRNKRESGHVSRTSLTSKSSSIILSFQSFSIYTPHSPPRLRSLESFSLYHPAAARRCATPLKSSVLVHTKRHLEPHIVAHWAMAHTSTAQATGLTHFGAVVQIPPAVA